MSLYNQVIAFLRKRRFVKNSCLKDSSSIFISSSANIRLCKGSVKENVVIGANSQIYGLLISMGGGIIDIEDYVFIGTNAHIYSADSIKIGKYTQIANNVTICDNNNHPVNPADRQYAAQKSTTSDERSWLYSVHAPITIGENCWLGEYSRICKGCSIGNGSIVAANAVVTKDVPANCVVAGNPAKIVKTNIHINTTRFFVDL